MKRFFPLILGLGLLTAQIGFADEQTRDVQSTLKEQGFYYGPLNGENSQETSAAIRRYQIRNGLQVTGSLNQETLDSLFKNKPAPQESSAPTPPESSRPKPEDLRESDERAMRAPQERPEPSIQGGDAYSQLFRRTPFEHAPVPVQQETFRTVQDKLIGKGYFNGRPAAEPTESLRRAIASYQEDKGLRVTGILDMDTLHELRMLPGESGSPFGASHSRPEKKIYRGIEIR